MAPNVPMTSKVLYAFRWVKDRLLVALGVRDDSGKHMRDTQNVHAVLKQQGAGVTPVNATSRRLADQPRAFADAVRRRFKRK